MDNSSEKMNILRFEGPARRRIDVFCAEKLRISRAQARRLLQEGLITMAGRPVRPAHLIKEGETVTVEEGPQPVFTLTPTPLHLDILFENSSVIAVNKPAGLLTHPTVRERDGSLLNGIASHTDLAPIGAPLRPGVVHRLDRETSGVIIFAKTYDSYWRLSEQFANRIVRKTYLAIVAGEFPPGKQTVECTISASADDRTRMEVHYLRGKKAVTEIECVRSGGGVSLVRVKPLTGRTHQIRITLTHLGFPVIGDTRYGTASPLIGRTALHAETLRFNDPETGKEIFLQAPLPADMEKAVAAISPETDGNR